MFFRNITLPWIVVSLKSPSIDPQRPIIDKGRTKKGEQCLSLHLQWWTWIAFFIDRKKCKDNKRNQERRVKKTFSDHLLDVDTKFRRVIKDQRCTFQWKITSLYKGAPKPANVRKQQLFSSEPAQKMIWGEFPEQENNIFIRWNYKCDLR